MIVDGKKIAEDILTSLEQQRAQLPGTVMLGVVMSEGDKATESFVRIKERVAERLHVEVVREFLPQGATTAQALDALRRLVQTCAGIVVQLPLPSGVDTDAVLAAIPPDKDVDFVWPPVGEAVAEVLLRIGVFKVDEIGLRPISLGLKAVVVGAGRLVGAPAAEVLRAMGANVTVVTLEQGSLTELADADIVVSGAGSPGLIQPHMLKPGVVLVDAGTSESSGRLVGDCAPECADVASVFTPVPGGIGPIAVALLFKNLFDLVLKYKAGQ